MAHQCSIDLCGRDLLTAAIDQIGLAAVEREETVVVQTADVPGLEPAVDEGCVIEAWVVEVGRN